MKKRVCHITSVHGRYDVRIFQKECRSLARNGYEVYLVVNDEKEDEVIDGVHIVSSRISCSSRVQRMLKVGKGIFLKALTVNAYVYHIHDPELLPYGMKLLKKRKKVIFDSHEFYARQILLKQYIPKLFRRLVSIAYQKYEGYAIQKIDGVIVPCLYKDKDYFKGKYKRQVFINNVPSLSEISEELYDVEKNARQVCYVGTISADRGIYVMIKASVKAKITLALAGRINSLALEGQVANAQKEDILKYYGEIPHIESCRLISQSSIGLCLLQNGGQYEAVSNLSTKMYEYMALGVPVVASDFPYFKRILQKEECGICVNPADADAVSVAIKELIQNPVKMKEMGERGQRLIKEKYCWEKEEKKLLKFYEVVIENKGRGSLS